MELENRKHLLDVHNLKTHFYTDDGIVKAVDGVDFYIERGEVFGIVGESGCGKSVTSLSIMNLIESPGKIESGEVFFEGENILEFNEKQLTNIRGNHLSMIFQQPLTSLDPVFSIGDQIKEVFDIHNKLSKEEIHKKTIAMLNLVGIPDAESKVDSYPHQMSGGQAQRVMIAMALALEPRLLIADEPTTALDVTIQAQILDLLRGLQNKFETSIILITHDLGVIAEMADRVAVMYAGVIVEKSDVASLFDSPLHPYTQGLLASIPIMGQFKEELETIPGNVPNLINMPSGCRFADRCKKREEFQLDICDRIEPKLISNKKNNKAVRCWLFQDHEGHDAPMKKLFK